MYHIDSDHESQIAIEEGFNSRYLKWVRDYIKRHIEIENDSTIRTGRPNVGVIKDLPVVRRVFFSEPDEVGLPSIYLGYQAMWDEDRNVLVVRDTSDLGKELRRIQIERAESIPSSFGYPNYVGVRILETSGISETIEKIFCYGRCGSDQIPAVEIQDPISDDPQSDTDTTEVALDYAEATRSAADAPKTGFSPLVGNLQLDQYEILDTPADLPLFVQGPPGSGKTVIAMSRARDLAHIDFDLAGQSPKKVLLIGPTDRYVSFVKPLPELLARGASPRFDIKSLRGLVAEIADTPPDVDIELGLDAMGQSREVAEIVESFNQTQHWDFDPEYDNLDEAARQEPGRRPRKTRPELFHNGLRNYAESLANPTEASTWIADLPTYTTSRRRPEAQVLLALSRTYTVSREQYDYIVVDEAQDMSWASWRILMRLLSSANQISAFGDFEQSKGSSNTPTSWAELQEFLKIPNFEDSPTKMLVRSFRCTRAIMNYAARQSGMPSVRSESLRTGSSVAQKNWAGFENSGTELMNEILRMAQKVEPGVMAVCALEIESLVAFLLSAGCSLSDESLGIWELEGLRFYALDLKDVASVEFDGLVVAGLSKIKNDVSSGSVFTLLTRPAKELFVFM